MIDRDIKRMTSLKDSMLLLASKFRKKEQSIVSLLVIAIAYYVAFSNFFGLKFLVSDNLKYELAVFQGLCFSIERSLYAVLNSGRLLALVVVPLKHFLPYVIHNEIFTSALHFCALATMYGMLARLLHGLFKSISISCMAILFAIFSNQDSWTLNLLTAYPFGIHATWALLFFLAEQYRRALENNEDIGKNVSMHLAFVVVFLVFGSENIVTNSFLFFAIFYIEKINAGENRALDSLSSNYRSMSPIVVALIVYILIYLLGAFLIESPYQGNKIEWNASDFIYVIGDWTISGLPGHNFLTSLDTNIHNKYANFAGYSGYNFFAFYSYLKTNFLLVAAIPGLVFYTATYITTPNESVNLKRVIPFSLTCLVMAFAQNFLVALTTKYQTLGTNVSGSFDTYIYTFYSGLFFAIFFALFYSILRVKTPKMVSAAFLISLTVLFSFNAFNNHVYATGKQKISSLWPAMDSLLEDLNPEIKHMFIAGEDVFVEYGTVHLRPNSGPLEHYWKHYAKTRHDILIEFRYIPQSLMDSENYGKRVKLLRKLESADGKNWLLAVITKDSEQKAQLLRKTIDFYTNQDTVLIRGQNSCNYILDLKNLIARKGIFSQHCREKISVTKTNNGSYRLRYITPDIDSNWELVERIRL